jgi:hypothetical protein
MASIELAAEGKQTRKAEGYLLGRAHRRLGVSGGD